MLKTTVLLNIFVESIFFFQDSYRNWNRRHLYEIFWNIINDFTVTFDQSDVTFMNKTINFLKDKKNEWIKEKNILTPNEWQCTCSQNNFAVNSRWISNVFDLAELNQDLQNLTASEAGLTLVILNGISADGAHYRTAASLYLLHHLHIETAGCLYWQLDESCSSERDHLPHITVIECQIWWLCCHCWQTSYASDQLPHTHLLSHLLSSDLSHVYTDEFPHY